MIRGRIRTRVLAFAASAFAALAMSLAAPVELGARTVGDARLIPLRFADLPGWATDDHGAALSAFSRSCAAILAGKPSLRPAGATGENLLAACRAAREVLAPDARAFFERHFVPHEVRPPSGAGFLTGYFEPEYEGSPTAHGPYRTPLLARPDDLVTIPQGQTLPGVPAGFQGARKSASGGYEPYPDRAAIEQGALGELARPIVHLRDPAQAFIVHVQGSARIRFEDGRVIRVGYAGRNGQPYSSIGKIIVERGHVPLEEMSLERLLGWLRDNPDEGREIMRLNRSYIFFRVADELAPDDGPIGGGGFPLVAGRSLAVDRGLWRYGLPFWIEGTLPRAGGGEEPLARLMIAHDTGSAIVGPARGDFYAGGGAEAGTVAGLMRHRTRFVVLLPRVPSATRAR